MLQFKELKHQSTLQTYKFLKNPVAGIEPTLLGGEYPKLRCITDYATPG